MAGNTPEERRAADAKREVSRVRRKYKVNLSSRRALLPGEEDHVIDMVLVLKLAGYSRSQMAKVIGISRGQIKLILEQPEVTEKLVLLREKLPQAALDLLQGFMIEAVMAIADVMRTSQDNSEILKAAADILDRGGLPKASRQERHQVNEDRTVFTDDGILDRLREAPVEVQEQAAQLIESLEKMLEEHADTAASEIEEEVDEPEE